MGTPSTCGNNGHSKRGGDQWSAKEKKKVLTFGERKYLSTKGEGWSHKRKKEGILGENSYTSSNIVQQKLGVD